MNLRAAPTNENLDTLRFVSESGRWEIGVWRVMFGYRVRAGLCGALCCELDYCAGADKAFRVELLMVCLRIFAEIPEDISLQEFHALGWPGYEIRPINLDPCWPALQAMAKRMEKTNENACPK